MIPGLLILLGFWALLIVLICVWFKAAAYHDNDPWPLPDNDGEPLPGDDDQ